MTLRRIDASKPRTQKSFRSRRKHGESFLSKLLKLALHCAVCSGGNLCTNKEMTVRSFIPMFYPFPIKMTLSREDGMSQGIWWYDSGVSRKFKNRARRQQYKLIWYLEVNYLWTGGSIKLLWLHAERQLPLNICCWGTPNHVSFWLQFLALRFHRADGSRYVYYVGGMKIHGVCITDVHLYPHGICFMTPPPRYGEIIPPIFINIF